jgi:hypothetical protein
VSLSQFVPAAAVLCLSQHRPSRSLGDILMIDLELFPTKGTKRPELAMRALSVSQTNARQTDMLSCHVRQVKHNGSEAPYDTRRHVGVGQWKRTVGDDRAFYSWFVFVSSTPFLKLRWSTATPSTAVVSHKCPWANSHDVVGGGLCRDSEPERTRRLIPYALCQSCQVAPEFQSGHVVTTKSQLVFNMTL